MRLLPVRLSAPGDSRTPNLQGSRSHKRYWHLWSTIWGLNGEGAEKRLIGKLREFSIRNSEPRSLAGVCLPPGSARSNATHFQQYAPLFHRATTHYCRHSNFAEDSALNNFEARHELEPGIHFTTNAYCYLKGSTASADSTFVHSSQRTYRPIRISTANLRSKKESRFGAGPMT